MKFLLDEGVPRSVGVALGDAGHEVVFFGDSGLAKGSPDAAVCAAAEAAGAVLVAADHDMKRLARGHGITPAQFKSLGLLRFECPKPQAAVRVETALSLIEHEATVVESGRCPRLQITVGERVIRTHR